MESLVFQLKPLPSWLLAGSLRGWVGLVGGGRGRGKPPRLWPVESKASVQEHHTSSSAHTASPPPTAGTGSENPSLCKQGGRKASTLIWYQFSFSSSATWLDPQQEVGARQTPPLPSFIFFSGASGSSPAAWLPGVPAPASWRREASYLHRPSEGRVSVCLHWGGALLPPSSPPSSLGMGCRRVYLAGGGGEGWWAAGWKGAEGCGVPLGS